MKRVSDASDVDASAQSTRATETPVECMCRKRRRLLGDEAAGDTQDPATAESQMKTKAELQEHLHRNNYLEQKVENLEKNLTEQLEQHQNVLAQKGQLEQLALVKGEKKLKVEEQEASLAQSEEKLAETQIISENLEHCLLKELIEKGTTVHMAQYQGEMKTKDAHDAYAALSELQEELSARANLAQQLNREKEASTEEQCRLKDIVEEHEHHVARLESTIERLEEKSLDISSVSFYGDGYIHLRTLESSVQTTVHVRFRTSSGTGLLFVAAGHGDFLLVELISGRLQVRLDLGSGERSLRSEKHLHLSDLAWHAMQLTHDRHNITLTVDRSSHAYLHLPGPDLELSVSDGLFVGDKAWLTHPYLGNSTLGFRGCMDEVVFNEHNLLSSLRPYSGYKSVYEVSLGCSLQFSATEEDPVRFYSSKSFIALPPWEVPQEGVFQCELHPSAREADGVILYSVGNRGAFVAIEVQNGHLMATVGRGKDRMQLRSLLRLQSGFSWRPVELHLLPRQMRLKVGEETMTANLTAALRSVQLKGNLYVGGLSEQARAEARRSGQLSVQPEGQLGSFKGCLREIRVNGQKTGLPKATISKDVTVECERKDVTATTASPTESTKTDATTAQAPGNAKKSLQFLVLKKLEVAEGGRATLELKHVKVHLNYRKLQIHPSQLMFRVEAPPVHGHLRLDLLPSSDLYSDGAREAAALERELTFSVVDLWQGRVMYVHSGSEEPDDFFMFSVFSSGKKALPLFLKGNRLHRFDVSISPVNDAPVLSLPEGNRFTMLENSKRKLTTEVLRVTDPDSAPEDLVFNSLADIRTEAGYLEHHDYPDRPINIFSLQDLRSDKISFSHSGLPNCRLPLRVSDGEKFSNTVTLRITAVPLEYKLINNSGLEAGQGRSAIISTNQLAVQVNVADQGLDIRYDVTEPPRYGDLQRLHSSGEWKSTTSFAQKLLEKERIRYVNTYYGLQSQSNATDQFKCKVSIGSHVTEEVVVAIALHWLHFKVTRSKMELNGLQEAVITPDDLHAFSKGVRVDESELYFRLLTIPKKGQLHFNSNILQMNSTFSQKNITDGLIAYKLFNKVQEDARDAFSFQLHTPQADSASYDFRMNIRAESNAVTVQNKGLSISEGASKVITQDVLFTHTASNRDVEYKVVTPPRNGYLRRINLSNSTSINDNIVTFTNQDIIQERVMYVHDDSETKQDFFTFQTAVSKPQKHGVKKEDREPEEHRFNISVQLVNDQKPVRVVDKAFHVARDGQRLVTLSDLRFRDEDSDFDDSWLVYTRRGIPMGELVLASDANHKVYEFTQRDLQQNKVLFIHRGVSSGRFVLFVTDGKHYVSTLLEVVAQDPYLQVENNTGVMVQRGGVSIVTSANLSVLSNLDIQDPEEVTFEVFLPPDRGLLHFIDKDFEPVTEADAVSTFTQQDLVNGRLAYHHDGSQELFDMFNVTARARERSLSHDSNTGRREVHLDIGIAVKIYLESHQRAPTVLTVQPVVVEEGCNISISRQYLEVVHENTRPPEIVFTVKSAPSFGSIQRNLSGQGNTGTAISTFTQEDINQGLIFYHQHVSKSTNDSVLLEATNGVTTAGPIRLEVDVMPLLLPLKVSDLRLDEGSSLPLTPDVIRVNSHHFAGMNFLYEVVSPPRHGHLEHNRIPGVPITAFTHSEVERELISYIHDGSETLTDNFTITVNQTEVQKHSLPCTLHIDITPVNDESPTVTINKGLKVWVGSVTEISVNELSAEDVDTRSVGLEFVVTPPSNGHLALKSAPSRHILNFTQSHVEAGQLVFVHNGALTGGFHFQVNDGVHFAPRQIFSTTAHSLVLTLQKNHPLEVYPGSLTPITAQQLQVVSSDDGLVVRNHSVVFAITTPPKLGRLVQRSPGNATRNISTFTQNMLNEGQVLYQQNKPEMVGWSAADTFSFTVSSPPAFLPPHTFSILVSYRANEHRGHSHRTKLLNNAGAVVAEGGRVRIDRAKLDATYLIMKLPEAQQKGHHIMYSVVSLPKHGVLSIQGQNLTRDKLDFSQVTLNKHGITYLHDDSETTSDSFTFRAWVAPLDTSAPSALSSLRALSSESSSYSPLYSAASSSFPSPSFADPVSRRHGKNKMTVTEMFNITVTPVNDHPPLIRGRAPSMKVVVGERVVLGPNYLQVEDHDTPPEELHYLVISKPNNGYLTLGERPEPVTSFTQYDINHERLHFIQKGEPITGVFYFNVTDGYHRPLYKLFSLEVVKPSVVMVNNTGLSLVQGKTAVVLTTNQLSAQTNSQGPSNITYTVISHPRLGRIAINDQEVTTFGHQDLQLGRVVYHMTDLSESEDSFEISASAQSPGVEYGNVTAQTVTVKVLPLIYLREPVRVPSGIAVKLGKAMIDASELARISRADPVFEVLSPPKHGKLVKMTYDPSRASEVLKSFTFRDVVQGRVAIEETLSDGDSVHGNKSLLSTAQVHAPAQPLNDSFSFLVRAGTVQPAKGELHFTILPHHQMRHGPGGGHKGDKASRSNSTRLPSHNRTTSGEKGHRKVGVTTPHRSVDESHPHILHNKNLHHNKTHHRGRHHHRWGNHTRSGTHGLKTTSQNPAAQTPIPDKTEPENQDKHPVYYEILPRPASDPLLIILPLLACLLLIVILIVLILVFRHRKEKQAQIRLLQELAALPPMSEASGSPSSGCGERSVAMPSVVVTPLGPYSCPTSPRTPISPRRRSLAPGMTFWGPFDDDGNVVQRELHEKNNLVRCNVYSSAAFQSPPTSRCHTPSLKDSQYWV
ncbi:chondroitin sulfate proteoglycan 4-like [Eucyclogobius newberryi]|uniref:chondroitin sulfate proteoglycan 4-like n=1 Tax=Eucyclogobius newberryi TaxID=166745 RepID=UPI003B5A7689